MFARQLRLLVLAFALSLLGTGCAMKSEETKVSLRFPDWNEMRKADLERQSKVSTLAIPDPGKISLVGVIVSGADVPDEERFRKLWKRSAASETPPSSFVVENVPKGLARLVQVLALYDTDNGVVFYYGAATKDFSQDVTDVPLVISDIASSSSTMEGTVLGRFLNSDGTGYTGPFDYRFTVNNRPSFVVHRGEAFGGWLHLFSFVGNDSSLLRYAKPDGAPLFEGVHHSSNMFYSATNPERAVRVYLPAGYQERDGGVRASPASRVVLGFFGPGAALKTRRVCLDSTESGQPLRGMYADAGKAIPMKWLPYPSPSPAPTPAPNQAYIERVTPPGGATPVPGGTMAAGCSSSGVEWDDYMVANMLGIDGGHGALKFRGPFKVPAGADGLLKQTQSGTTLKVEWDVLPGADAGLSNWGVFYRDQPSVDDSDSLKADDDGIKCNELVSHGFTEIRVGVASRSVDITGVDSVRANQLQVAVCPYSSVLGKFFETAADNRKYGSGGCQDCMQDATQLAIKGPMGEVPAISVFNNSCTPIEIEGRVSSTQTGRIPSGTTITFSAGDVSFYTTESCMSMATTSLSSWGGSNFRIYAKRTTAGSSGIAMTVSANVGGTTLTKTATLQFADPVAPTKVRLVAPTQINAYECYSIDAQSVYENAGIVTISKFSTHETLTMPAVADVQYFSGGMSGPCSGAAVSSPSTVLGGTGGIASTSIQFMYKGTGSNLVLSPAATSSGGFPVSSITMNVTQPGVPSKLRLEVPNQVGKGSCITGRIYILDSNGRKTPATQATTVSLNASLGAFYEGASCMSAPVSAVSFPAGEVVKEISFKSTTQGSSAVSASTTAGHSLSGQSYTVTVGPAAFQTVAFVLPGQTFTDGIGVSGAPATLFAGQTYTLKMYATTASTWLAAGTTKTISNININGGGATVSASSVAFAGGYAEVNFTPTANSNYLGIQVTRDDGFVDNSGIGFAVLPSATQISVYLPTTNVTANACQIFTLVPEDSNGAAALASTVTVNLSADNGALVYMTSNCDPGTEVTGTFTMGPADKVRVYFYKNANTGASQITASVASGVASGAYGLNVVAGSVGAASKYMFTGRAMSTLGTRCQPYVVSVADSNNQFVTYGSNITNANFRVDYGGGGTVGAFFNSSDCSYPIIDPNAAETLLNNPGYRVLYFGLGTSGASNLLRVTGGPFSTETLSLSTY